MFEHVNMKSAHSHPENTHGNSRSAPQNQTSDRAILSSIARQAMIERGMEPDFPATAQQELAIIGGPAEPTDDVRDLRELLWVSIDNDDSLYRPPNDESCTGRGPSTKVRVVFGSPTTTSIQEM